MLCYSCENYVIDSDQSNPTPGLYIDFTVLGHAEPPQPQELIIFLYSIIKFNTASIVK